VDWSNERYVRIYTRDTETVLLQSWQARHIFREMCRKCDRAGVIECRTGVRGLAVILNMASDAEVVARHLPELLADGSVREIAIGYFLPNFVDAQEAPQSDKHRAKESRERRRDLHKAATIVEKLTGEPEERTEPHHVTERTKESRNERSRHETNENVTARHSVSHGVTPSVLRRTVPDQTRPAVPSRTDPNVEQAIEPEPAEAPKPQSVGDAALALTIAANQAIDARYGEQLHPLLPGTGVALAQHVLDSKVPLEFAERAVRTLVANRTAPDAPGSMSWFAKGITRLWSEDQARRASAATPIGSVLSQPPKTFLDALKAGARKSS
jgi:hypothetical protein